MWERFVNYELKIMFWTIKAEIQSYVSNDLTWTLPYGRNYLPLSNGHRFCSLWVRTWTASDVIGNSAVVKTHFRYSLNPYEVSGGRSGPGIGFHAKTSVSFCQHYSTITRTQSSSQYYSYQRENQEKRRNYNNKAMFFRKSVALGRKVFSLCHLFRLP
jgi:hypothetical protein